ncbi:Respiratory supercomplex factor 2, mitochondrial [Psilocybe cubensis]|uniref:Respiratory supercomplex factor 2, mitochondrial n=2 Tax=Psilocybe cubensis TaxID=181762 RepID=A0ACB8H2Y6_PSICU|nr:Respiratory supercomplex factor 2, mitochondrial [Psilocybe cubensis]KAH9482343.1 Respiratory supercomplex factor 2, mitochondrial [Psilocybe cubensis]
MKLLTDKQREDHAAASRKGALEGTLASGAVALAGSLWANKRWPAYRRLPLSLKTLGVIIIVAPCLSIQAERRGLEYERSQWEGEGLRILDEKEIQAIKRWDAMSLSQKIGDWSFRHQYSLIMGGWAGSLAIAGAIISRQKYQTYPQKIVQARMWAQGLTIGLLIVAGALTQSKRAAFSKESQNDHSWKDVLDQQERDRQQEAALLAASRNPAAVAA